MPKNPLGTYLTLDISMPRLRPRRLARCRVNVSRSKARSAPSQISTGPRLRIVTPSSSRIFIRSLREPIVRFLGDVTGCVWLTCVPVRSTPIAKLETQSTDQCRAANEPRGEDATQVERGMRLRVTNEQSRRRTSQRKHVAFRQHGRPSIRVWQQPE